MAEIRVETRRSGGRRWLWVLLLLIVLAALAYWYFVMGAPGVSGQGSTARPATTTTRPTSSRPLPSAAGRVAA